MPGEFDPYHKWLGIPPRDQPPNHYRLLGIETFENDAEVIEAAANRIMSYLQEVSTGDAADQAQPLLNEISAARICLLNTQKKSQYDATLREQLQAEPRRSAAAGAGQGPARSAGETASAQAADLAVERSLTVPARVARKRLVGSVVGITLAVGLLVATAVLLTRRQGTSRGDSGVAASNAPEFGRPARRPQLILDWPASERTEATLYVNGRPQVIPPEGTMRLEVRPGANSLIITREGYQDIEWSHVFSRGDRETFSPVWQPSEMSPSDAPIATPGPGRTGSVANADRSEHGQDAGPSSSRRGRNPSRTGVDARSRPSDPVGPVAGPLESESTSALDHIPRYVEIPEFSPGHTVGGTMIPLAKRTTGLIVRLVGGERILGGRQAFQLTGDSAAGSQVRWTVQYISADSRRTPVACLDLRDAKLHFSWAPECRIPQSDQLRNCLLDLSVGDRRVLVALRAPIMVSPLHISTAKRENREELAIRALPRQECLVVEITRSSGLPVFSREFQGQVFRPEQTFEVNTAAEDVEVPLRVRGSFKVLQGGDGPVRVDYSASYLRTNGEYGSLSTASLQRDLRLIEKRWSVARALNRAADERERLARARRYYEALRSLDGRGTNRIDLHFVLSCELAGNRVVLARTEAPPDE